MVGNDAAPRTGALRWFALLLLCTAYIQGPMTKILDFPGALAEMTHFGLTPAPLFAVGVIVFAGTGIQDNLADKARKMGIPVYRFGSGGA